MTSQIEFDTIVPGETRNAQGVLRGELERMHEQYALLMAENNSLHEENLGLRMVIARAGLDLPEALRQAVELVRREPVLVVHPIVAEEQSALLDELETMPVSDSLPVSEPVAEELEVLKLNLATATERLDRVESKSEELEAEDEYKRKVMAFDNQILSGAQKLVFLAVREYIFSLWHTSNALGQFVHVPFWDIQKKCGLSTDTIGSAIKRLHEVGLVVRDEQDDEEMKRQGKKKTQVLVALTLLSFSLEIVVDVQKKRGHGGDTRFCKFCNSPHLTRRKRVTIVCDDCHRPQEEPVETSEPVNAPDPMEKALKEAEESQRQACKRAAEKKKTVESLDVAELDEELAHLSDEDDQEAVVAPDLGLGQMELLQEEDSNTIEPQNSDTVESTGPQDAGRSTDEAISGPILSEQSMRQQRLAEVVNTDENVVKLRQWSKERGFPLLTFPVYLDADFKHSEMITVEQGEEHWSSFLAGDDAGQFILDGRFSRAWLAAGAYDIQTRPPKPDIDCALCWRDHKKHVCSWVWSSQGGDNGVPGYCCLFCYSSYGATLRELEQRQQLGICEEPILKLKRSKAPYSVEMMRRELLDLAEKCGYPALKWRCEGIVYELDGDEDTYLTRVVMNDLLWMWMAFQVLEQTYGKKVEAQ